MLDRSLHADRFARDHLPPAELWPVFESLDTLRHAYSKEMNAAAELLDRAVAGGLSARPALHGADASWSYAELMENANRIAGVLVNDLGLIPGNRVLLRSPNNPMLAAAWLGVVKAGGIVVATMPLLRAKELSYAVGKAKIALAVCDSRLADEMEKTKPLAPGPPEEISERSMPAQKARPAPLTIATRTPGSAESSRKAAPIARRSSALSALSLRGRLSSRVATGPSRSTSRTGSVTAGPPVPRGCAG